VVQGKFSDKAKLIRIVGGIVGVVAVIAVAVLLATGVQTGEEEVISTFSDDLDPIKGPADASVLIQEFADFQCPACKDSQISIAQLFMEFGDGIKVEYENLPLPSHQMAIPTALAGECAFEQSQDLFWSLGDFFFDSQEDWSSATSDAFLFDAAQETGVEMKAFRECMVSEEALDKVQTDVDEAAALAINSTPTFFVNGKRIVGGSYPELSSMVRDAIDE